MSLNLSNQYAQLPAQTYAEQQPQVVAAPKSIIKNNNLAEFLQIDNTWLYSDKATAVFSGNQVPPNSTPIASAYAGHQFGQWNPQLGDGRAVLLGETKARNGKDYDIQLKGSGTTPFSRGGDGRSALGSVLREYLISEWMHTMGVPTTRALAAVETGEYVHREQATPGAILTRVAGSHIRVGTFQFFAARGDTEATQALLNYVIQRHYPHCASADDPAAACLEAVIEAQALLIAQWQSLGFIHGVMNTDNMLVGGETVDYGPCAFMDEYQDDKVFSSIDQNGRYAYQNQPAIGHWNLAQLAQCLLPLMQGGDSEDIENSPALKNAQRLMDSYPQRYIVHYQERMRFKLGLVIWSDDDDVLLQDLLAIMQTEKLDFTQTFTALTRFAMNKNSGNISSSNAMHAWIARWLARRTDNSATLTEMQRANPVYIPRNHQVESVIKAATWGRDYEPFYALHKRLASPFDYANAEDHYASPPQPEEVVTATFCGT